MNRLILAFVLLLAVAAPARASSVHVSPKRYVKEVNGILQQYEGELALYMSQEHPGVDAGSVSLYLKTAEIDIVLVQTRLHLFKQHKVKQDDVDKFLAQLSRDIENTPPAAEAPQILSGGDDPRPKA